MTAQEISGICGPWQRRADCASRQFARKSPEEHPAGCHHGRGSPRKLPPRPTDPAASAPCRWWTLPRKFPKTVDSLPQTPETVTVWYYYCRHQRESCPAGRLSASLPCAIPGRNLRENTSYKTGKSEASSRQIETCQQSDNSFEKSRFCSTSALTGQVWESSSQRRSFRGSARGVCGVKLTKIVIPCRTT